MKEVNWLKKIVQTSDLQRFCEELYEHGLQYAHKLGSILKGFRIRCICTVSKASGYITIFIQIVIGRWGFQCQ